MKPPTPLFDTLREMPNPFREPVREPENLSGKSLPGVRQDLQLASEFLFSYRGSPDTFATYRREVEHFLQWCWVVAGKTLPEIGRADLESYLEFAQDPPASWIGSRTVRRFLDREGRRVPNPRWRPYTGDANEGYLLSPSAVQSLFSVLSSFFNFLIQENHTTANPVTQMRQKGKFLRRHQGVQRIRRLSPLQWTFIIEAAEDMARQDPATHERTLFIMSALFGMYLRISELVETERWAPQMGHFQRDMEGNWWFLTVGKGNKEREISVSDEMLEALKRYRQSRSLPELPEPGESSPLIHRRRGRGGITSTRQIRSLVQECFDQAEEKMRRDGFHEEAQRMAAATVHWLRHTGISEDVKHRPREHVRDDAGHGSSAITDRYIDVERSERHASARRKRLRD